MSKDTQQGFGFRALSVLMQRTGLARLLNTRFNGNRDYYSLFGYKDSVQYEDMLAKFLRDGVAKRVVNAPAEALWNNPPQVMSNNDEWNRAWNNLVVRHKLWLQILKVDRLCGMGSYSCLFIGTDGQWSPEAAATKPRDETKLRNVTYLQPYSMKAAEIDTLEDDPTKPQYMMPKSYELYPFKQTEGTGKTVASPDHGLTSFKAHYTRILHIVEGELENSVYGTPRLEAVFNYLDDLLKVAGGTSETYWLTANRGLQIDIDKDMELDAQDAKDLTDEIEEYQNQVRRFIRTRGTKIQNLGSDVPNPKETFEMLISLIAGSLGMPKRILMGAEAGQLASDQDRANWAEKIENRRTEFGEPVVIFPLIAKLTGLGVLPAPEGLEITVEWPEAFKLNPLEKAQRSAQHARSATNLARAFETMHKINSDEAGSAGEIDPETGQVIPGTEVKAKPGAGLGPLVTMPEARRFMDLDAPIPTIDDPEDVDS